MNNLVNERENVRSLFNSIFRSNTEIEVELNTCEEKDDTLTIGGALSIRLIKNSVNMPSIRGTIKVDGYIVDRVVHVSNYPHEPDDVDYVEVGEVQPIFGVAVQLAVKTWAEMLYENAWEMLHPPCD